MTKTCSVRGCKEPHLAHGYCQMHYAAFKYHGDPRAKGGYRDKRLSAEERFDLRVQKDEIPPCWIIGYSGNAARISINGRNVTAARFAYERWIGPVPEGHRVIHTCHIPACVNPEHLGVATHKGVVENMGHRHSRGKNLLPHRR